MTTLVYADCDAFAFVEEMKELFPLHYEELCVTKEFPLMPDYDAYKRLADAGMLRCITCRADDELIGYILFYIHPHMHYMTCNVAYEDLYFIRKDYRKGRVGIKLFKYAEEVLKGIGVNRIIMHTKIHLDNSRLFEYLGYTNTDKLYSKIL
jgi:GNAT superfamily N-acetyltransferase